MRGASGERYTWKGSGAESGEAYALIEAEVPPNAGPPLHLHRRKDESFYVLAGTYQPSRLPSETGCADGVVRTP